MEAPPTQEQIEKLKLLIRQIEYALSEISADTVWEKNKARFVYSVSRANYAADVQRHAIHQWKEQNPWCEENNLNPQAPVIKPLNNENKAGENIAADRPLPQTGETYLHYKGGIYRVITMATHSESKQALVIYSDEKGVSWARPLEMFLEVLGGLEEGHYFCRFEKVG